MESRRVVCDACVAMMCVDKALQCEDAHAWDVGVHSQPRAANYMLVRAATCCYVLPACCLRIAYGQYVSLRNECAIRCSRVESTRLFLKTFWKSQMLHLYPRRQDQGQDTHACFSNHGAPTPLHEDRNCAAVILFVDGVLCA